MADYIANLAIHNLEMDQIKNFIELPKEVRFIQNTKEVQFLPSE